MDKWRRVRLGDVAKIVGGGTPSTKNPENYGGKIPWITPKDLSSLRQRYIEDGERSITQKGLNSSSAKLLPPNTILFTSRAPIGYIAIAKNELATNQGFKNLIINEENDNLFFYYLLKYVTSKIKSYASGSTFLEINSETLKSVEVDIPEITIQKSIAHILGTLDDKIELNQKMNETLESMAQAIFQDWFIDFGPTRRKMQGATDPDIILGGLFASDNLRYPSEKIIRIADLFSDTLVSNGLPKGSKKSNFGDLVTPKRGKTITKKQVISGEIPVIAGGRRPAYYHNVYNVCGPVVTISSSGANAGFVRLYNENIWASDCSFINRKQTDYLYSTYVFLKYQQDEIYRNQQGAVQPHVYPSDLERLKIVNLPLDVWKECENLINPLFMCISENQFQSQLLAKIRDLLLSRLISGEVRLKNNKNLA